MAKPITYTPDLENEASASFNKQLQEAQDQKMSAKEREDLFSFVDRVLANSQGQ